jgi:hypothetical protein
MLKHGVDRPTGRHTGMRSLLPRHPQRSMEARHAQATATRRSACFGISAVSETRKLAAILVSDIVGYSGLRARMKIASSPDSGRCAAI